LAGLINALKFVNKKIEDVTVVVLGLGSAGIACIKLFAYYGVKHFRLCDRKGLAYEGELTAKDLEADNLNDMLIAVKGRTESKSLADAMVGADVFVGVSGPEMVTAEMVKSMAKDPIIFAMANPTPEIMPDIAKEAGAAVIGTGRSDFPNQVNNVLAFPGIFKGALSVRASKINEEMKVAATNALAGIISDDELSADYIIASPFDERVVDVVSAAVAQAAIDSGVARINNK